jgi:hypothetical protein
MIGIELLCAFIKDRLKKLNNLINKAIGKSKIEKNEISFLSQNLGLKNFIFNY